MSAGLPEAALAAALGCYGLLLAGPASSRLAAAGWTHRAPRAALVLWQAICLGAGLSLVGAGVVVAVAPLGDNIVDGLLAGAGNLLRGSPFDHLAGWRVVCGLLAALLAGVLLTVLVRCFAVVLRRRHAHRALLDLLDGPAVTRAGPSGESAPPAADSAVLAGVRVLDHRTAVAYSVPGWRSRVVLSAGMVDLLTPVELTAVLTHERAHLRSRHDLLVLPFQAWAAALGVVPGVRRARASVGLLAEMLADDNAARRSGGPALASALAKVAMAGGYAGDPAGVTQLPVTQLPVTQLPVTAPSQAGPAGAADRRERNPELLTGAAIVCRVLRVRQPHPLPGIAALAVYLAAVSIVLVPTVVLLIGWR